MGDEREPAEGAGGVRPRKGARASETHTPRDAMQSRQEAYLPSAGSGFFSTGSTPESDAGGDAAPSFTAEAHALSATGSHVAAGLASAAHAPPSPPGSPMHADAAEADMADWPCDACAPALVPPATDAAMDSSGEEEEALGEDADAENDDDADAAQRALLGAGNHAAAAPAAAANGAVAFSEILLPFFPRFMDLLETYAADERAPDAAAACVALLACLKQRSSEPRGFYVTLKELISTPEWRACRANMEELFAGRPMPTFVPPWVPDRANYDGEPDGLLQI